VSDPRTKIVGDGYDAMADTWEAWAGQVEDDPRAEWLEQLVSRLPEGARVVELGCGNGTAETVALARRFRLTGVDLSGEQLRRARERVPGAEFLQADFTALELEHGSLDAVAAFYSFNHVPRDLLAHLFGRIHQWLVPGGLFLAALGAGDTDDWFGEWLGAPMFFSSFPPETNSRLLAEAGFELERDELVTIREPKSSLRDETSSTGCDAGWLARTQGARIAEAMSATEDTARRRAARPDGTALHSETSSKGDATFQWVLARR